MAVLDPDNCIKLFKLEDSTEATWSENVVIIPARENVLQTMFNPENSSHQSAVARGDAELDAFSDEAVDLLLKFRLELEELFRDCGEILGIAAVLWEDISYRLFDRGFSVTGKQCSAKWEALYAKYLEVAYCDDESCVLGWKHFSGFEHFYKLRSKYIDSKILEDVTEFLNSRFDSCTTPTTREGAKAVTRVEERDKICENVSRGEEFTVLNNEEESQMLAEAINTAQQILEDNLKESSPEMSTETRGNEGQSEELAKQSETAAWKYEQCREAAKAESSAPAEQGKRAFVSAGSQVFVRSEKSNFYWDTDTTQCFLDLRLYLEKSRVTKLSAVSKYKSINAFVSRKMTLSGYNVSEMDCGRKWAQVLRYYNKEAKALKDGASKERLESVRKYFWQIDKVLRKSGLEINAESFSWDERSIRKLIGVRISMESAFAMFKKYVILWQYVALQMAKHGFLPTYSECSIKWMELYESYTICLDLMHRGCRQDHVRWIFFQDMLHGFQQNAESAQPAINYGCSTELNGGTAEQAAIVGTGIKERFQTIAVMELKTLNGIKDFNGNVETDVHQDTPKVAAGQRGYLEIIDRAEKRVVGEPGTENNSNTNQGRSEVLNSECKAPGILLLNLADEFEMSKQPEQSLQDVISVREKAGTVARDHSAATIDKLSDGAWTEAATLLFIKLKLSRELKFRNPSFMEVNLWKEIARDMQNAGHNVSHKGCAARWCQLAAAYEENSPESNKILGLGYREQLKLTELALTRNIGMVNAPKTKKNSKSTESKAENRFIWTDEAIKTFLRFRFSPKIRDMKLYGSPVAKEMRAAGYSAITPTDVSKKWSRMHQTYKRSVLRKKLGEEVKWEYFQLIHNYIKDLPSTETPEQQKKKPQCLWTLDAAQKLIDCKVSMGNSCDTLDCKESLFLWTEVADAMKAAGYHVTQTDCTTEWNFLVDTYKKTKRELCSGNGAVIGEYFIMMDKAINKINKSNDQAETIREPIDLSIARLKGKVEGLSKDTGFNTANNIHEGHNMTSLQENETEKASENEERVREMREIVQTENKGLRTINESLKDLNLEITILTVPAANASPHASANNMKELDGKGICVNSSAGFSHVSGRKRKREDSVGSEFTVDRNEGSSGTDEASENEDCVDSSKENLSCAANEPRTKAPVPMKILKGILCNKKSHNKIPRAHKAISELQTQYSPLNSHPSSPHIKNTLIQDRAVNSTENIEGEEPMRRWSDTATHLLIDLVHQHNKTFPGWPKHEIKWEGVAAQLARLGCHYTQTECRHRWYSLKTNYEEKLNDGHMKRSVEAWPYFEKIDSIHKELERHYDHFKWILPKKKSA